MCTFTNFTDFVEVMNMLRDPPTFKEVAKIFIVGFTLRSYTVDDDSCGDKKPRRTCLGHEMSRRISVAVCGMGDRHLITRRNRRRTRLMSPEWLEDYEPETKKRADEQQLELNSPSVQDFAAKSTAVNVSQ